MTKSKIECTMESYGIYSGWDKTSKELPSIRKFTTVLPARLDIEFGYILYIRKAKGNKLAFRIEHPPFRDDEGRVRPAFTGELYVRSNDWRFFLGDTIWEPLWDKVGDWRLITWVDGQKLADKTLKIVEEGSEELQEGI